MVEMLTLPVNLKSTNTQPNSQGWRLVEIPTLSYQPNISHFRRFPIIANHFRSLQVTSDRYDVTSGCSNKLFQGFRAKWRHFRCFPIIAQPFLVTCGRYCVTSGCLNKINQRLMSKWRHFRRFPIITQPCPVSSGHFRSLKLAIPRFQSKMTSFPVSPYYRPSFPVTSSAYDVISCSQNKLYGRPKVFFVF